MDRHISGFEFLLYGKTIDQIGFPEKWERSPDKSGWISEDFKVILVMENGSKEECYLFLSDRFVRNWQSKQSQSPDNSTVPRVGVS